MEKNTSDYLKGAVEALLFISEKPVTIDQIKEALESATAGEIKRYVQELKDEYDTSRRGMMIMEIAGGYQMLTSHYYANYIRNFFKTRVKEKLSGPALETLAIIAYKQPVSRADIELIRGVNSDGVVLHLCNKDLIKITGRKDVPGRPYMYGTTKQFLEYFGLKSLSDLPKLDDFPALTAKVEAAADEAEREAGDTAAMQSSTDLKQAMEGVSDKEESSVKEPSRSARIADLAGEDDQPQEGGEEAEAPSGQEAK